MIERDYLIVGGGIAALSACEGIRQHDKKGTITMVGNELHPPYERPALSKLFLQKTAPKAEEFYRQSLEWYNKQKIDLRLGTIVTQFNIERHIAVLQNGQTIHFEKAILATGSRPLKPQVAGFDLGNIIYLRSMADAMALREMMPLEDGVIIIGGGLLATEVAASLSLSKKKVSILSRDANLWHSFVDPETAAWITNYFRSKGVNLHMRDDASGFEGKTVVKNIQTKNGGRHTASLVVVAVGSEMNLGLVRNTPLSTPKGSPVNEFLETEEKGIYSVGDIALFPDKIYGGVRRETHWEHAKQSGLVAGGNITGKKRTKYEFLPHHQTKVFDLELDFVGDFNLPPVRVVVDGARDKKSFLLKYMSGERLRAAVLCNRKPADVEAVKKQIRADYSTGK
ncbi:MAG: FAD-dependent oxidoreductase [Verrucomicrobia bacterium]|nr:FAD-dependent oxidoreductase [Verrucomicrobiota bacterium]